MGVGSRHVDTSPALWREFYATLVGAMEMLKVYSERCEFEHTVKVVLK
jgi:hypothetical protein